VPRNINTTLVTHVPAAIDTAMILLFQMATLEVLMSDLFGGMVMG
jgi:hypothetical protein